MLKINQNFNDKNTAFGSKLAKGAGIIEHLRGKGGRLVEEIKAFKDFLEQDGKEWTVVLGHDTFEATDKEAMFFIEQAAKKSNPWIKAAATKLFAKMANPNKAFDAIAAFVKSHSSADEVARTAGEINDSQIAAKLIRKLIKHDNSFIRYCAAESTWKIKDPKVQAELLKQLKRHSDAEVKRGAEQAEKYIIEHPKTESKTQKISVYSLSFFENGKLVHKGATSEIGRYNDKISWLLEDAYNRIISGRDKLPKDIIKNLASPSNITNDAPLTGKEIIAPAPKTTVGKFLKRLFVKKTPIEFSPKPLLQDPIEALFK